MSDEIEFSIIKEFLELLANIDRTLHWNFVESSL